MRLVDTDRFAVVSSHIIPEVIEDTWEEGYCACLDIIDAMPTIEAIPIEQLLSILPKYDDYIHTKTYPHNETMEDIYSKGHEEGWNACLKAIKEELEDWEKENGEE